jgi:hypothetical protein
MFFSEAWSLRTLVGAAQVCGREVSGGARVAAFDRVRDLAMFGDELRDPRSTIVGDCGGQHALLAIA